MRLGKKRLPAMPVRVRWWNDVPLGRCQYRTTGEKGI